MKLIADSGSTKTDWKVLSSDGKNQSVQTIGFNPYHIINEEIIVELKTSMKKNLDDLIRDFPFQRTRFSKYCNGVEKMGKFEI